MDGHPLILLKHGGPSRKKASLYGKVAQIYFALRGSFLLCAQHRCLSQVQTFLACMHSATKIWKTRLRIMLEAAILTDGYSLTVRMSAAASPPMTTRRCPATQPRAYRMRGWLHASRNG